MSKRAFQFGRMQNTTLYPTDLTDEQWNVLQLALPSRKAHKSRGRPPAVLGLWLLLKPQDNSEAFTMFTYRGEKTLG